jgi:Deoxyribonuclease II
MKKIRTLVLIWAVLAGVAPLAAQPVPLIDSNTAVDWWFVFKFNAKSFPASCPAAQRMCPFGGTAQPYKEFSQQFAFASSANPQLQQGGACVGATATDPVGATFGQLYNGKFFYVVWNDQFYGDPMATEDAPWGHAKGMLAWGGDGNGFVMQISTPDWPGSGGSRNPRKTMGNTLGCIAGDDDIEFSQHFFALKLNSSDVVDVLKALANASVVTDPKNPQIVNNGGPAAIQSAVNALGSKSASRLPTQAKLSSGVTLISKASGLHVPPWQMVSSLLGGEPLRAATWWASPEIYSTTASTPVSCWDASLKTKPAAVEIATTGTWQGNDIGLTGNSTPSGNHAKIGVSTGTHNYAIFGDMNQQGSLTNCTSSQDGRGGLFFVVDNAPLHDSVRDLIKGDSAPVK